MLISIFFLMGTRPPSPKKSTPGKLTMVVHILHDCVYQRKNKDYPDFLCHQNDTLSTKPDVHDIGMIGT